MNKKVYIIIPLLILSMCGGTEVIEEPSANTYSPEIAWCNAKVKVSTFSGRSKSHFSSSGRNTFSIDDYILLELLVEKNRDDYPWLDKPMLDAIYIPGRKIEDNEFVDADDNHIYLIVNDHKGDLIMSDQFFYKETDSYVSFKLDFRDTDNIELCKNWYTLAKNVGP